VITTPMQESRPARVRVWDLPTRLMHWAIVVLVAVSWWTHQSDHMDWHRISGYTLLGVLVFRIYWGFAGATTARFSSFVRGPRAFVRYAGKLFDRSHSAPVLGHNPMGGWSVLALLALLLIQTSLGLFSVDTDGLESGPLASFVSFDTGRLAAEWHERVFNLLLVLIAVHVIVVLFYLVWRRENLVSAMVGGYKRVVGETPADLRFVSVWRALLGIVIAGLVVWAVITRGFHLIGG
jgi:cytochrome b